MWIFCFNLAKNKNIMKQLILKHKGKTIESPNEEEIKDFLHETDEEIMANIKAGISFSFHTEETETQLIWMRN